MSARPTNPLQRLQSYLMDYRAAVSEAIEIACAPLARDDAPAAVLSDECRAPGPSDCLSCGKRCSWPDDEKRPDCSCGLGDGVKLREHWSSCAVWDDDQVAKLADMEAEEASPARLHVPLKYDAEHDMYVAVAPPVTEYHAYTSLTGGEPLLTADELVAVRGLIQERYEGAEPTCDASIKGCVCVAPQHVDGWHSCKHGAKWPAKTSPAASAPGVSPSEACDIPSPSPSEGRSDAAAEWVGWAVPAICTVMAGHQPIPEHHDTGEFYCADSLSGKIHDRYADWQSWSEHVAPLITAHIVAALPDFPAEVSAPTK